MSALTFERPSAPAHAQGGLGSKPADVAPSPIDAKRDCDARRGTDWFAARGLITEPLSAPWPAPKEDGPGQGSLF